MNSEKLRSCYQKMSKECGIEVGDTVRILQKAKSFTLGWENDWHPDMDDFIGNIYRVRNVNHTFGIKLDTFSFPFFILEVVKKREKYDFRDLEVVKELNREMWNWLAEDPKNRRKSDWPRWDFCGGDVNRVIHLCFLCVYAGMDCSKCPGNWSDYTLIHNFRNADHPCEIGEYGFYLNEVKQVNKGGMSEIALERIYNRIANICE